VNVENVEAFPSVALRANLLNEVEAKARGAAEKHNAVWVRLFCSGMRSFEYLAIPVSSSHEEADVWLVPDSPVLDPSSEVLHGLSHVLGKLCYISGRERLTVTPVDARMLQFRIAMPLDLVRDVGKIASKDPRRRRHLVPRGSPAPLESAIPAPRRTPSFGQAL